MVRSVSFLVATVVALLCGDALAQDTQQPVGGAPTEAPPQPKPPEQPVTDFDPFSHYAWKMNDILENRCATAICFGGRGRQFALEPVLDLPIGKALRLPGADGEIDIADRVVEGDSVNISLQAGLRFWLFYDAVSVGMLFLNVSLKNDIPTPTKTFTGSSMKTPAPGMLLGVAGDLLQVSMFRYVIRNDSSDFITDGRTYAPYQEVSSGWILMFSFAPFTALRNLGGGLTSIKNEKSPAKP